MVNTFWVTLTFQYDGIFVFTMGGGGRGVHLGIANNITKCC